MFCFYSSCSSCFLVFFSSSLVLSRVCVMFTSLNLKPVFSLKGGLTLWHRAVTEQRLFFVFIPSVNWIKDGEKKRWHPRKQVKGWKKCNVYCCTIFSNKRTQNLFVLFFMWTLPGNFSPSFLLLFAFLLLLMSWVRELMQFSHIYTFHLFSLPPFNLHSSFHPVFASPNLFCHIQFLRLSVTSVLPKHGHKCRRLLWWRSPQRLNIYTTLLQSKQNSFQSLLQFCKKCVHFFSLHHIN